ncbi:MAG: hypothetical protein IIW93_09410 [Bacteroidaceae bacterium]|nr:hypothetical protein [Bacteroidaceae bacterium]
MKSIDCGEIKQLFLYFQRNGCFHLSVYEILIGCYFAVYEKVVPYIFL